MNYSVNIIDLLRGSIDRLSAGGIDGRVLSITTDNVQLRDLVIKVDGVATWEAMQEADTTWLIYLAPAHGITIFVLRERVTKQLEQAAAHNP